MTGRPMRRNLNDLAAFVAVARAGSFTRAAAALGVSQSALSHTLRGLEAQLGVRLLTRTTRSVAPTEAGERLLLSIGGRLDEIEDELQALAALRERPAGTVRITSDEHALESILWPRLEPFMREYPDIQLEFDVSYRLKDIVAERFDAGVRLGERVERDMVAMPISLAMRMAVVGSPGYFATHPAPASPRDLSTHDCIGLRLDTLGGLYAWEFERDGRALDVQVKTRLVFNRSAQMRKAALKGFGLAYVPEDMVDDDIATGRLHRVLADWCPAFAGYHLYYPDRRLHSPAFALVRDALRYPGTVHDERPIVPTGP